MPKVSASYTFFHSLFFSKCRELSPPFRNESSLVASGVHLFRDWSVLFIFCLPVLNMARLICSNIFRFYSAQHLSSVLPPCPPFLSTVSSFPKGCFRLSWNTTNFPCWLIPPVVIFNCSFLFFSVLTAFSPIPWKLFYFLMPAILHVFSLVEALNIPPYTESLPFLRRVAFFPSLFF